jgi:lipopolysaccharide/colanic/teichoic acid biosynthesis glycosyltransferase
MNPSINPSSSKTVGLNNSETKVLLKSGGKSGTSPVLTMKWEPLNQTILTKSLYSDLLPEHDLPKIEKWIKRGIDILGAVVGLIMFSPVMLAIALIVKATSCGPILFRQERMGFLGKKFTFLKFRSMYIDCSEDRHKEYIAKFIKNKADSAYQESECKPLFKMNDDPRVTPF